MVLPDMDALEGLAQILPSFLRKNERVLLCFPGGEEPVGKAVARHVERCGAVPVFWGRDLLWKNLLRRGFQHRCSTIIGPAGILLGLSKLVQRAATPLYIRNAVLLGDTPDEWIRRNIAASLDCTVRGWIPGGRREEEKASALLQELRRWATVLDMKIEDRGSGLSLELVTFPGEKLPKLPSFARLVIRSWEPDSDIPYDVPLRWRTSDFSSENH